MKIFKSFSFLGILAMIILMAACVPDPETKEIYGTFAGSATQVITKLSTSEEISNVTQSATLTITKSQNKMNVMIDGENSYLTELTGLPALDVSGDKNYRDSYKSEDGSAEVTILSPDFDNVTCTVVLIEEEDDVAMELSFKGKRM